MLRLAGARLLSDRDYPAVRAALAANPIASCMVGGRVEVAGLDPRRLGGELWTADGKAGSSHRLHGLCFSGPNLIPLSGDVSALRAFADRALRRRRRCSSLVGPAEHVLGLWDELADQWGPPRELRRDQPLLAIDHVPSLVGDPLVRRVRPDELDRYLPAAIAMFTEEVGIDPTEGDRGVSYRARVAQLIANGRAFARFDGDDVVFKAEIGALSSAVAQIQGVWVRPDRRGQGLGTAGTASVVARLVRDMGRTASLYVNAFNTAAIASYRKVGFEQVGRYATVLF